MNVFPSLFRCAWAMSLVMMCTLSCNTPVQMVSQLDPEHPVLLEGRTVRCGGQAFRLGKNTLLVGPEVAQLSGPAAKFTCTSLQEALAGLHDGTEASPMTLCLLPGVHWLDDPDDEAVRRPVTGSTPYAVEVNCSHLHWVGLSPEPENVVVAVNRGQMAGAEGNFTMMHLTGDDIHVENITFGNYCNVDLVFPLDTTLNRPKRTSTITQSQLFRCNSDKVFAENCSFVSRLNACPFSGAYRALFHRCHIECGDDALCGSAVYYRCDMDFYSSKPFWSTRGTGTVFLDCDVTIHDSDIQYINKVGNPVALVDCRFYSECPGQKLEWTAYPALSMRCYQYGLTLNGRPVRFNESRRSDVTVEMEGRRVSDAYRFEHEGKVCYNLYGLLRGKDGWDPMQYRKLTEAAEKASGKDYTNVPVMLRVTPSAVVIETGKADTLLRAECFRFYDVPVTVAPEWHAEGNVPVKLAVEGAACRLTGCNEGEEPVSFVLNVSSAGGLESAVAVTVLPRTLPAPGFASRPALRLEEGKAVVRYLLENQDKVERADRSLITWYRCRDEKGDRAIPVAVSRGGHPEYAYPLTAGDVGYFLMAVIEPKHSRSETGAAVRLMTRYPVSPADLSAEARVKRQGTWLYETDFHQFPTSPQLLVLPGFWTVDAFKPADTGRFGWKANAAKGWLYGTAQDGAVGQGLLQGTQGARLLYTPVDGVTVSEMEVSWLLDPCKTAGQGFGSPTGQYLDLYIQFDTRTLTGCALRIERTTRYSNAVDFSLVSYEAGKVTRLTEAVSATCFLTGCAVCLKMAQGKLTADVTTATPKPSSCPDELPHEVHLSAKVEMTGAGGYGLQHTGTAGSGATMLHALKVRSRYAMKK